MKKIEISTFHFQQLFKPLLEKHKWRVKWTLRSPSNFSTWYDIEGEDEVLNDIMNCLKAHRKFADDIIEKIETA